MGKTLRVDPSHQFRKIKRMVDEAKTQTRAEARRQVKLEARAVIRERQMERGN